MIGGPPRARSRAVLGALGVLILLASLAVPRWSSAADAVDVDETC